MSKEQLEQGEFAVIDQAALKNFRAAVRGAVLTVNETG